MPQWLGAFSQRIPIAELGDRASSLVAGLAKNENGAIRLFDHSGNLELGPQAYKQILELPAWVALQVSASGGQDVVFQKPLGRPDHPFLQVPTEKLRQRWQFHAAIRQFFNDRHFTEVETPIRVSCPGMEPYLDSFPAGNGYLRTSPELHMKRILASGIEPIFQLAPCFRAGDHGSLHREEFTMLEWYRLFADLDAIAEDIEHLLNGLASLARDPAYFMEPLERRTCASLFLEFAGLDLRDHHDKTPLRSACGKLGIHHHPDDDWDTLFFRIFMAAIEPHLGMNHPMLVTDYPASQSALAKCAPLADGRFPTCYRFELFIKGIEIANAFYELTDPEEQRQRFETDREIRRQLDKPAYPIDEAFMGALESGLPPAAGIALGVDRLWLCMNGSRHFNDIAPFG